MNLEGVIVVGFSAFTCRPGGEKEDPSLHSPVYARSQIDIFLTI